MKPLISVIIPVYKVEKYLDKCIQSVVSQSYDNLEIILIDDGSPDMCGSMCDQWRHRDSRIKVIHQKNSGLSAARNAGLDIAKGDYIGFVDSDDWIESVMFETLLNHLTEYNADIAICCIDKVVNNKSVIQNIHHNRIYTRRKALFELINDRIVNSFAWNKLYRKELFNNLRYPVGKTFEDTLLTFLLFEKANRIVHINQPLYHYIRRDDSILGSWSFEVEFNFALAQRNRFLKLSCSYPEFSQLMIKKFMEVFWNVKKKYLSLDNLNAKRYEKLITENMLPFCKNNLRYILSGEKHYFLKKINILTFCNFPFIYKKLYKIIKR